MFLTDTVEDILGADDTHVVCTGHDYDEGGHVNVADARLIAAAPALLAALKALRKAADDSVYNQGPTDQMLKAYEDAERLADAAIANAEGTE